MHFGLSFCCDDLAYFKSSQAQLANYIQYTALLEGWTSRMWTKYTGVLIWKTQNPWPGLRGQLYDHFLDQTAGFYGCRCAAEPIHVQLNLAAYFIEVSCRVTWFKSYLLHNVEIDNIFVLNVNLSRTNVH